MGFNYKLLIQKSENEFKLAKIIFEISINKEKQLNITNQEFDTYFSAVITHCYYSIFYMAKAYLMKNNLKTTAPEEHKKVYEHFKQLKDDGKIDYEIFLCYTKMIIKAEELLDILKTEKIKRGKFTYQRLNDANKEPSKESLKNAEYFFKHVFNLCET